MTQARSVEVRQRHLGIREHYRQSDRSNCLVRYSILIQWSDQDQVYILSLPEWGDLVHTHGTTYEEALRKGQELLDALEMSRRQHGEPLPVPRVSVAAERLP